MAADRPDFRSDGLRLEVLLTGRENLEPMPIPQELDYDLWLGPAPYKPYNQHRVHQTFRGWDYEQADSATWTALHRPVVYSWKG